MHPPYAPLAHAGQEPEQLELPLGDRVAVHCGERDCLGYAVTEPPGPEWVFVICPRCKRYGARPPISRCDTLTSVP